MNGGDLRIYNRVLELCKENKLVFQCPGMTFRILSPTGEILGVFEEMDRVRDYLCGYASGYAKGEAHGFKKGASSALAQAAKEARALQRTEPHPLQRRKRFTLIEVIVLCGILAIVVSLFYGSSGCSMETDPKSDRVAGTKINTPWGIPGQFYSITVDGHDYLFWRSGGEGSGTLCHKADCKKCTQQ